MTEELYTLHQTKSCFHCGAGGYVKVKTPDLLDYLERRKYAQDAFHYLPVSQVEQIISGTHPDCWDKMFPPELEDEDEQPEQA